MARVGHLHSRELAGPNAIQSHANRIGMELSAGTRRFAIINLFDPSTQRHPGGPRTPLQMFHIVPAIRARDHEEIRLDFLVATVGNRDSAVRGGSQATKDWNEGKCESSDDRLKHWQ